MALQVVKATLTKQSTPPPKHFMNTEFLTGHIIVPVKNIMYFQSTWQWGLETSQYVFVFEGWHPGLTGMQVGTVSNSDTQGGGGWVWRGHVCREQQENPLTIKVSTWDWQAMDYCVCMFLSDYRDHVETEWTRRHIIHTELTLSVRSFLAGQPPSTGCSM